MRWTARQRAATAVAATIVAALAILDACSGSGATVVSPGPTSTPTPRPTVTPIVSPTADAATQTPTLSRSPTAAAETPAPPAVTGFRYPIEGACLPASDALMPNAPRTYRAGIHEGVDFYPGLACAAIAQGTPVLTARDGTVSRADLDYVPLSPEELNELLTRSQTQGYTDAAALDRFRGRQVWIDHGGGTFTRYAHLDGIAPGIALGTPVQAGQVVGYVGESGTPESVTGPGAEMHLHFELWVSDSYLGAGLPPDQVRALWEQAFSLP